MEYIITLDSGSLLYWNIKRSVPTGGGLEDRVGRMRPEDPDESCDPPEG